MARRERRKPPNDNGLDKHSESHILLAILRMPACLSFSTELVCAFRPVTDERVEVDVCKENIFVGAVLFSGLISIVFLALYINDIRKCEYVPLFSSE